eukprot:1089092-Pyramimonas_sp.AAC.1
MWVQKPRVPRDISLPPRLAERMAKRGKNVHIPLPTKDDITFASSGLASSSCRLRAELVRAPAQCLPQANTSTVHDRLCAWSVVSASGSEAKVDRDGSLNAAVSNAPW